MMRRRAEPRVLRRRTDRVEDAVAFLLTAVAAVGLVLACSAAVDGYSRAMERGRTEAVMRIPDWPP